jgi:hypothetical protein
MKVKDILAVLGTAAATTAFTVGLLGPGRVAATGTVEGIKPVIAQPKLTVGGCVFSLETDKPAYKAGDTPTLRVKAANPTDKRAEATIWLSMSASSPASPMSRMVVLPKPLWTEKYVVSLEPGQTRTVPLDTRTKLPAGESVSITISDKDLTVLARALSVEDASGQVEVPSQTAPAAQLVP